MKNETTQNKCSLFKEVKPWVKIALGAVIAPK